MRDSLSDLFNPVMLASIHAIYCRVGGVSEARGCDGVCEARVGEFAVVRDQVMLLCCLLEIICVALMVGSS